MKWLIASVLIGLIALAGCGQKTAQTQSTSTDSEVSGFEKDIAEIDSLDKELDSSEMDAMEQDFESV